MVCFHMYNFIVSIKVEYTFIIGAAALFSLNQNIRFAKLIWCNVIVTSYELCGALET